MEVASSLTLRLVDCITYVMWLYNYRIGEFVQAKPEVSVPVLTS